MTRQLAADRVPTFVRDELMSPERARPIVMVSSTGRGEYHVDADTLEVRFGSRVDFVKVTGAATWALRDGLPPKLDVFNGSVRIWWPGMSADDPPEQHPLFPADGEGGPT